jgi:hypothetical protein
LFPEQYIPLLLEPAVRVGPETDLLAEPLHLVPQLVQQAVAAGQVTSLVQVVLLEAALPDQFRGPRFLSVERQALAHVSIRVVVVKAALALRFQGFCTSQA